MKTAGKIKKLIAKKSFFAADQVAFAGRELSSLEMSVYEYQMSRQFLMDHEKKLSKNPVSDKEPATLKKLEKEFRQAQWCLCSTILRAIDENNIRRLSQLPKAVKFLQTVDANCSPIRMNLLTLKMECERRDVRYTISEIAEWLVSLGEKGMTEAAEDGFSQLRRLCNDLKVPYRRIRKKSPR